MKRMKIDGDTFKYLSIFFEIHLEIATFWVTVKGVRENLIRSRIPMELSIWAAAELEEL